MFGHWDHGLHLRGQEQVNMSRARPATGGGRLPRRRSPGRRVKIEPILSKYFDGFDYYVLYPRFTLAISFEGRGRGHESTMHTTQ